MRKLKQLLATSALLLLVSPAMACGPSKSATHMGAVLSVDAKGKTFTIRDAQTQAPLTFLANNEIIAGLKNAKGSVMVNYEEDGDNLKAVGVTF